MLLVLMVPMLVTYPINGTQYDVITLKLDEQICQTGSDSRISQEVQMHEMSSMIKFFGMKYTVKCSK